jgi:hypothetical protein
MPISVSKNCSLKLIIRKTYTEVGDDGIEFGEREVTLTPFRSLCPQDFSVFPLQCRYLLDTFHELMIYNGTALMAMITATFHANASETTKERSCWKE